MIRGTDGLDYEDLTARLLGEPVKSWRNHRIQTLRAEGASEDSIRAWSEWHDSPSTNPATSASTPTSPRSHRAR